MTKKQRKKIVRLISAISDMRDSVEAADLLIGGAPPALYPHLFISMVVAYGRPFFESDGVGRIQCDYPDYPDFGDSEMPVRHKRLIDIRNKFIAHSSAEGTHLHIFPPGVLNPLTGVAAPDFDFNIGKRTFHKPEYFAWLRSAPATFKSRLHHDLRLSMSDAFGTGPEFNSEPFELVTTEDDFRWSRTSRSEG